jgi:hypothetical protein
MANTGFLSVSELSFDGIKSNLKTFMKSKTQFQDYDFEGSNLSALLDVLSYNTYMNSFYLNMVGSEMFLDSARLKQSVVSHAKELNYLPRSRTSAKAQVTFNVNTGTATPSYVIIPEDYTVRTVVDGINYSFSTEQDIIINNNGGYYVSDPVYVYEGKIVTEYFTVANNASYVLSSNNVDTNSIKVTVINSSTDSSNSIYSRAYSLYGLTSSSKAFFVDGAVSDQYAITFGDGVFGKALTNGNIIKVKYRSTNGESANKASSFTATSKIDNLYNVTVTTNAVAIDGSEREDIESIRLNAPKFFATQNRAVTADDYKTLLLQKFPQIKTVNIYGGEDANPPQFGKVVISAIPYGDVPIISSALKSEIISYLTGKSITTEPVILDPEYLFVEITSDVKFDPSLTTKSTQQLKSEVLSQIINYDNLHLNDFGDDLRKSKLLSMIDSSDDAIISNQTDLRAIYKITPTRTINNVYNFTYGNSIYRPVQIAYSNSEDEVVRSSYFTYYKDGISYDARITDDGIGNLRIYFLSQDSTKVILDSNIGTVNYSTGELTFTVNPYDYTNSIDIYAKLNNDDIIVQNNKFLKIDYSKVYISINVFSQ